MSNELLGDDLKLYYDTAGDFDTPTWVEQISVGDVGFDPANEQVEIPKRISVKTYKKGRGDWSLSFTSNISTDNTFHMAVIDAINYGTAIHIALALGDIEDGGYWHAWWMLSGPVSGSLDSTASIEVEGKAHHDLGEYEDELPAFVALT